MEITMSKIRLLYLFTLFIISVNYGQSINSHPRVKKLLNQYEEALSSKSADKIANCFHNNAMVFPQGKKTVNGRIEIIENFKNLETIDFAEKFTIQEVIKADNYFIVQTKNTGSWANPQTAEKGKFEVKGQMILKPDKQGNLKIYRYMYNSNN